MAASKKYKKLPIWLKMLLGILGAVVAFYLMSCLIGGGIEAASPLKLLSFQYPLVFNGYTFGIAVFALFMIPMGITVYEDGRRKNRRGEDMGSADWIDPECSKKYRDEDYFNNQIFTSTELYSRNMRKSNRNRNILLLGRPGTGKSRYYFKPNLLQRFRGTVLVTDPKGELLRDCGYALKQAGYTIKCLNLDEMWQSNHYNPFTYLKFINEDTKEVCVNISDKQIATGKYKLVDADVLQIIASIMKNTDGNTNNSTQDPFWPKAEELYLESIMYYIVYNYPKKLQNFASLLDLMRKSEAEDGQQSQLDIMFDEWENGRVYQINGKAVVQMGDQYVLKPNNMPPRRVEPVDIPPEDLDKIFTDKSGIVRYKEWVDNIGRVRHPEGGNNIGIKQWHHFKTGVKSEKTMATILLSASARLAPLNIPEVAAFMKDDDMEMERLGMPMEKDANGNEILGTGGQIIWFIITKPNETKFNFIANLFYTQCFQMIDVNAKKFSGSCPEPVDMYMDEWAQLGEIPSFVETLAYVRGLNCGITIGLQSLDQLKNVYKDSWQTCLDCCDFLLYLGSSSNDTLKYFSEMLGKETIYKKSHSKSYGSHGSSSFNEDVSGRDLVDTQELRTLESGDCILMDNKESTGSGYKSKLYNLSTHPRAHLLFEPWNQDDPENMKRQYNHRETLWQDEYHKALSEFFEQFGIDASKVQLTRQKGICSDVDIGNKESLLSPEQFEAISQMAN